jgi:hypothetical protein
LQREHAGLRQGIEDFRTAFTLVSYVGPETRQPLLWRLVRDGRTILGHLKAHARFEQELIQELEHQPGNTKTATTHGNRPNNKSGR